MRELWEFAEILKNAGITDKEEIAKELLRVHLSQREFVRRLGSFPDEKVDQDQLFQIMKETTGSLGEFFSHQKGVFHELFQIGVKLEFVPSLIELFRNDRSGVIASPPHLVQYFSSSMMRADIESVLIPEAHKHLNGLNEQQDEKTTAHCSGFIPFGRYFQCHYRQ